MFKPGLDKYPLSSQAKPEEGVPCMQLLHSTSVKGNVIARAGCCRSSCLKEVNILFE